jgi:hypothetical protein
MNAMADLTTLPFLDPRQLPSADDIRQARSTIKQLDQNMEDLEQNIGQLRRRVQELEQKRANYVSYISPLRRLPTEILREIVDICIETGMDVTVMAGICSRLREVVLGMAGIWSNISLRGANYPLSGFRFSKRYGSSIYASNWHEFAEIILTCLQHGIQCTTVEQLELILTRAGRASLKLEVFWPVEMGTLELISSQDCLIRSLRIVDDPNMPFTISSFENLNLSQLQILTLAKLQSNQYAGIMDLALQSNCRCMTLDINYGCLTLDFFKHELLQRVIDMGIASRQ